ncbi:MAG: hypothetical protein KDK90_10180 [Leptospiraceae bacterium]|nr:hypothetical protein [Leptospiraceae bacterium]
MSNHYVKEWCGKRWRNIFITESLKEPGNVEAANEKKIFGKDTRPDRQKIAVRFLRGDGTDEWSIEMPEVQSVNLKNSTLLFCPGLLNEIAPVLAFKSAFPEIEKKYDFKVLQSDSHPARSCDTNGNDILNAMERGLGLDANGNIIDEKDAHFPGDVFIISNNKGTPDLLHLLVKRPDLKDNIRCIFNYGGMPGGTYLANDIYKSIKDINLSLTDGLQKLLKVISPAIQLPEKLRRIQEYDIKNSIYDLTTNRRMEFLNRYLPEIDSLNIPIFNLSGSTSPMEVPYFQIQGVLELNKYDSNNDMQVTQKQAKISSPMATDLAMLHAHHWDLAYEAFPKNMRLGSPNLEHPFPKLAILTTIFKFASELGLVD